MYCCSKKRFISNTLKLVNHLSSYYFVLNLLSSNQKRVLSYRIKIQATVWVPEAHYFLEAGVGLYIMHLPFPCELQVVAVRVMSKQAKARKQAKEIWHGGRAWLKALWNPTDSCCFTSMPLQISESPFQNLKEVFLAFSTIPIAWKLLWAVSIFKLFSLSSTLKPSKQQVQGPQADAHRNQEPLLLKSTSSDHSTRPRWKNCHTATP